MECSLPVSSVHGIFQARMLEWVPFHSPGDLPHPGIEPGSPALKVDSLPSESPEKTETHTPFIIKRIFYGCDLDNNHQQITGLAL